MSQDQEDEQVGQDAKEAKDWDASAIDDALTMTDIESVGVEQSKLDIITLMMN